MKLPSVKTALRLLAALALVGGGVVIERLSREPGDVPANVPRYKATVRIVEKYAQVEDAPERIKAVHAPDLLQKVVKALDLTGRWNAEPETASSRLKSMIEAQVDAGAPDVLIVTVRSTDKKEPEEIAAALTRAMARNSVAAGESRPAPELDVVADPNRDWAGEFKKQQTVLEEARTKIAALLLSGMRERPSKEHAEIRNRAGAIQEILRLVKSRNSGRDPAIPVSEDERNEFQEAIAKLKEKSGGDLTAQDWETLDLVNATTAEGSELGTRRRDLQGRLESKLRNTKKDLEDKSVAPEFREAYAKAKQEYETEFQRLNILREQAARQNADPDDSP